MGSFAQPSLNFFFGWVRAPGGVYIEARTQPTKKFKAYIYKHFLGYNPSETWSPTLPCCLHEQGFGARTWHTSSSSRERAMFGVLSGQITTHLLLWIYATWRVRVQLWTFWATVVSRSTLRFVSIQFVLIPGACHIYIYNIYIIYSRW